MTGTARAQATDGVDLALSPAGIRGRRLELVS
jgi:hypothetical protein